MTATRISRPRSAWAGCAALSIAVACLLAGATAAKADFGIVAFNGGVFNSDATTYSQAAGHPYSASTYFELNSAGFFQPDGSMKDVEVSLPPGFVGNPSAAPVKCTVQQLYEVLDTEPAPICPLASQVGFAEPFQTFGPGAPSSLGKSNLYAMKPPPGAAAMLGFVVNAVPVFLTARVRNDEDYGVSVTSISTSQILPVVGARVTIWGVPGDPSHDADRGTDRQAGGVSGDQCAADYASAECVNPWPPSLPIEPFITNPSNCAAGAQRTTLRVNSWQQPTNYHTAFFDTDTNGNPTAVNGCDKVPFEPTISALPTTNQADTPAGLDVKISMPTEGLLDPNGFAQANLKKAVVTLPAGVTVNPSSADGLGACSPAQIGLTTPIGATPIHFSAGPAKCPDAAKLGSVEVDTPLLDHPLKGFLFLASQNDNPFNSLLATYIAIDDPDTGVVVKLAGRVAANPVSGQLTATFDENPQLPFEDFRVNVFGGAHASLKTAAACGDFTTATEMEPWSAPETANATPSGSFDITQGAGGRACVSKDDQAPNSPSFTAGTVNPTAGAYTPFVLKLARQDGTQPIKAIDTALPKGLLGKLAGVPYCPDAALAASAGKSGKSEQASSSCPAASQVGTVNVAAGAGPAPLNVGGKAYLAGPYKGAPVSLAVITPAVAGPFDLGTVVVRAALNVDPASAQVHAVSDQLPTILQGIPLDVRSISLQLDKPQFTLNPTSCDPMAVTGSALSAFGQSAALSSRFQVGDCGRLGFKPRLAIRLKGGAKRSDNPALTATVSFPPGANANIASASVALPRSEFLDQSHIKTVCTRVQYAADQCPPGSVYGFARAVTPLLDKPLEGPVYLRSSSNPLPDLVAALKGQVDFDLAGRIDSVKGGGIRTTFEGVPDAPVSKFTLMMKGGKKGLLVNSRDICARAYRATASFIGQNGKAFESRPALKNSSCGKVRKGHKHKKG